MKNRYLYRYTTKGEGVWSAGKRLLPQYLVEEVLKNKKWLPKPNLPKGKYHFYLTEKGKEKYESTLLLSHKKYLPKIRKEKIDKKTVKNIIYQDEWQIVENMSAKVLLQNKLLILT